MMKKICTVIFLAGLALFSISCDNEVELTADFKDIPVVYGFLSREDSTTHYIRIQRAFLGEEGDNALDIAQIADSLYYDNIDVKIEREDTGEQFNLSRVDAASEGVQKENGIFASDPAYLYKLQLPDGEELAPGKKYILRINRGDDKAEVTASTTIVDEFDFTNPSFPTDINIRYRNFSLAWKKEAGAAFYDVKMRIKLLEEDRNNPGTFYNRTVLWNIDEGILPTGSNTVAFEFDGEAFYQFLGAELDDNGGFRRIFQSLDFVVDAGAQELLDYINTGEANTGITATQIIPTYSNLSEGFGIFSSKNRINYEGFFLKPEAMDSLANGIYTRDLGFDF